MRSLSGINRSTSEAAFGQVDWQFADLWTLTIGGRYSHDFKHIDNDAVHGVSGVLHIIPNTFANEREAGWGKFTPKISLRYEPTRALNLLRNGIRGFQKWRVRCVAYESGRDESAPAGAGDEH